ncbi:uncharacterized protein LOC110861259 isoform X2 [Folsomia candida]|uniref:uncharacterized protein LOC110861259 isoform X2 n=1 Tax=Folsomia candida TaxID=158441 RepID=UPI0016054684|nr:uncharacterized protein LOC110861259 isoform X2 [Folsomia candida]
MEDTAILVLNEPPNPRDSTILQFDQDGEDSYDVVIAPLRRDEVGQQMIVTYPDWSFTNAVMSITPLVGVVDEVGAYLRPNVGTTLEVRAEVGNTFFCCSSSKGRKMTIGNLIQDRIYPDTRFVERCTFDYPNSRGEHIDLFDPDSGSRVGWILPGEGVGVTAGVKIGLHADPKNSPRFTTCRNTEGGAGIMIRNVDGQTLATGKVTRSATYCGIKTYKQLKIVLPPLNSNKVSSSERTLLFATLMVWNYKDEIEDNSTENSFGKYLTIAIIGILLFITLLCFIVYISTL